MTLQKLDFSQPFTDSQLTSILFAFAAEDRLLPPEDLKVVQIFENELPFFTGQPSPSDWSLLREFFIKKFPNYFCDEDILDSQIKIILTAQTAMVVDHDEKNPLMLVLQPKKDLSLSGYVARESYIAEDLIEAVAGLNAAAYYNLFSLHRMACLPIQMPQKVGGGFAMIDCDLVDIHSRGMKKAPAVFRANHTPREILQTEGLLEIFSATSLLNGLSGGSYHLGLFDFASAGKTFAITKEVLVPGYGSPQQLKAAMGAFRVNGRDIDQVGQLAQALSLAVDRFGNKIPGDLGNKDHAFYAFYRYYVTEKPQDGDEATVKDLTEPQMDQFFGLSLAYKGIESLQTVMPSKMPALIPNRGKTPFQKISRHLRPSFQG